MPDILFPMEGGVFSYRVAGVLLRGRSVLLQHPVGDPIYALPGGHVALGETSEAALVREFQEEVAAEVRVERLLWIGENFFPWGPEACHQVCLYYLVAECGANHAPAGPSFATREANAAGTIEFCWVDFHTLPALQVYPECLKHSLENLPAQPEQFLFSEFPREAKS